MTLRKCAKCATRWTTDLAVCPICDTKAEEEAAPRDGARMVRAALRSGQDSPPMETYVGTATAQFTGPVIPQTRTPSPPPPIVKPAAPRQAEALAAVEAPKPAAPQAKIPPIWTLFACGPLVLGGLALVTVVLMPVALALEGHRVFGILGFFAGGFFAPFAPIAWLVGQAYEDRYRDLGLDPDPLVRRGKRLGMWATFLLVAEFAAILILVVALRLGGKFPASFWAANS